MSETNWVKKTENAFADPEIETFYTSYAMTKKGRELIERYSETKEAIQDTLDMWPEDAGEDACDVTIENESGVPIVYFARGIENPLIAHVYFMGEYRDSPQHYESYKCHYECSFGGSVRTIITRLG